MKLNEAQALRPGDSVFWDDLDCGACSRWYDIAAIEVTAEFVRIHDISGDDLECHWHELTTTPSE
jgi:hypothetical protein